MSIKAIILLKNREAMVKKINRRHTHLKFQRGLYVISEEEINNSEIDGKVRGSEIIWFEGNPNPVNHKKNVDRSSDYLNEIVIVNALKQTGSAPTLDIGGLLSSLSWLGRPVNWLYIIFAGVILYGLIAGGLGWV